MDATAAYRQMVEWVCGITLRVQAELVSFLIFKLISRLRVRLLGLFAGLLLKEAVLLLI